MSEKEIKPSITKLSLPAEVIDFLMDHYGFFDVAETNEICLYIVKSLAHMEQDGWKLTILKTEKDKKYEAYGLDIHRLIAQFRANMAEQLTKEKNNNESN